MLKHQQITDFKIAYKHHQILSSPHSVLQSTETKSFLPHILFSNLQQLGPQTPTHVVASPPSRPVSITVRFDVGSYFPRVTIVVATNSAGMVAVTFSNRCLTLFEMCMCG
ncbi:hypothetical protein Hdeb2414_s0007g00242471 [Helianthus debilis subsp. tardiflorus]